MPIIDSDTFIVLSATRSGTNQAPTNIEIAGEWRNAAGESLGVFTSSWSNLDELRKFQEAQDFDDVLRAVMGQCINRTDGSFRPAQFNALAGSTNTINVRVTRV
jgi:hypothetical protein